ncbi:MFS transporter [Parabacteroides sp. OttesenSCG-928-N08]|nr:MFS transporter [Parabacteroides sp. OttesenSCG-928-N08]
MENNMKHAKLSHLLPILFSFFIMGFVDVVGIATSYVKQDFGLNDKLANLLPMMVFLWFAVFSLPTGMLMGRVGRKRMVLISAAVTSVAMLIPLISYTFPYILVAFALLGIGNTILQVSLNPLLTDVVRRDRITSMLSLGQFVKAISSFLGPILAGSAAGYFGNWKLIFPVYAIATILSFIWLLCTPIEESQEATAESAGYKVVALLKNKKLLFLFSIIVLIVGFEIGLMTAVPKYLLERFNMPLDQGALGCSLYYAARTLGTFIGAILLAKVSSGRFMKVTLTGAILFFLFFMTVGNEWVLMGSLFLVGLCCANVFAVVFSTAMQTDPSKANEISALMIMGVAGGALIPPIMGAVADATNQLASLFVLLITLVYIFICSIYIIKN